LESFFPEENRVKYASLYLNQNQSNLISIYEFRTSEDNPTEDFLTMEMLDYIDHQLDKINVRENDRFLIPMLFSSKYVVYFYHFNLTNDASVVLVAVSDHNFMISSRPKLMYAVFLLFLGSVLISLLTIYLISKRFRTPLDRLIKGCEKTAQGELYYIFESNGDRELDKLTRVFNDMSKTLFGNHQKLQDYNRQLKETNQSLTESRLFFSTLIDSSPTCIVTTALDEKIMVFNKRASSDFGYNGDEVIGQNIDVLFKTPVKKNNNDSNLQNQLDGLEVLCKRKDGSLFPAYMITSSIERKEDNIKANVYIIRDISESKSFQEMMIRLDRYYTRGEMAGDIAHEINNFLAVLFGNIELMPLMMKRGDKEKIDKKLDLMKSTVEKISRFTDGLMDPNMGEVQFNQVEINQLVENMLAFLKPQNRFDDIEIITSLSSEIPLVELDIGQIQQLLVNLLNNAADALVGKPDNRNIVLKTMLNESDSGNAVCIEVRDNGPGVAKDKEKLLFKKRFTTKKNGHGIGLITCRKIIDAHQGQINYRFDEGALFTAMIPLKHKLTGQKETLENTLEPARPTV